MSATNPLFVPQGRRCPAAGNFQKMPNASRSGGFFENPESAAHREFFQKPEGCRAAEKFLKIWRMSRSGEYFGNPEDAAQRGVFQKPGQVCAADNWTWTQGPNTWSAFAPSPPKANATNRHMRPKHPSSCSLISSSSSAQIIPLQAFPRAFAAVPLGGAPLICAGPTGRRRPRLLLLLYYIMEFLGKKRR